MPTCMELSRTLEKYICDNGITGKMPGIIKLSRELGVNRITLGKAFHLLEEKGVLVINGTSGTYVNKRNTKRPRHHLIGLVGINSRFSVHSEILAALNRLANPAGYHVIGIKCEESLFKQNPKVLLNFPVDAVLFRYSTLFAEQAALLHQNGIPIVSCALRSEFSWLDNGDCDHVTGYGMILDHLLSLGHRRIAFLEFDRYEEYRYYLDTIRDVFRLKLGEDFDPALFFTESMAENLFLQYGQDYVDVYAANAFHAFFDRPHPPTAIVAPFSLSARIAAVAEKSGLRIPEDLSLVSISYFLYKKDFFTGIRFDELELLSWGIRRLLKRLSGRITEAERFLIPPVWFEGGSTALAKEKQNNGGKYA